LQGTARVSGRRAGRVDARLSVMYVDRVKVSGRAVVI